MSWRFKSNWHLKILNWLGLVSLRLFISHWICSYNASLRANVIHNDLGLSFLADQILDWSLHSALFLLNYLSLSFLRVTLKISLCHNRRPFNEYWFHWTELFISSLCRPTVLSNPDMVGAGDLVFRLLDTYFVRRLCILIDRGSPHRCCNDNLSLINRFLFFRLHMLLLLLSIPSWTALPPMVRPSEAVRCVEPLDILILDDR